MIEAECSKIVPSAKDLPLPRLTRSVTWLGVLVRFPRFDSVGAPVGMDRMSGFTTGLV